MARTYHVGMRLSYDSHLCTVRYIGEVAGAQKEWFGVEWDDPTRGKHDGEHKGVRYFSCRSSSKTAASFVRPTRNADPAQSFVEAIRQKYASEITGRRDGLVQEVQIQISASKTVEEVGFEKIRQQLAQLQELKIVIVDGLQIAYVGQDGMAVKETCPKIQELDLSRNLFETPQEIMRICIELKNLRSLRLNGNRLRILSQHSLQSSLHDAFAKVKELSLDEMFVTWEEVCTLATDFPALTTLSASSNEMRSLRTPPAFAYPVSAWNLKSLTLDYNIFSSILELAPLAEIRTLEKLHLKGNQIQAIADSKEPKIIFGDQLHYVDLSYNNVASWNFVEELSDVFPALTALRFSHNPVYERSIKGGDTASSIEEGYMLTLARIANLKVLNFSNISPAERSNAEMFYLSRIGRAMAEVHESEEDIVIAQHRRFEELCDIYGAPNVVRAEPTINPEFLEARLIKFTFYMAKDRLKSQKPAMGSKIQEIPKGFDVYQVKGIVGRMFGLRPLSLRLVWETGEWDPVAGYEDEEEEGDTDEEDEEGVSSVKQDTTDYILDREQKLDSKLKSTNEKGKWMRREVELENGTRQIGFLIDGLEAKVRVEILQARGSAVN